MVKFNPFMKVYLPSLAGFALNISSRLFVPYVSVSVPVLLMIVFTLGFITG
jgi:hypothetical protein